MKIDDIKEGLESKPPQMETEKKDEGKESVTKQSMVVTDSKTGKSESENNAKRTKSSANEHKKKEDDKIQEDDSTSKIIVNQEHLEVKTDEIRIFQRA